MGITLLQPAQTRNTGSYLQVAETVNGARFDLIVEAERIVAATGLDERNLLALLHTLLERIRFFDEDAVSIGSWTESWRLCRDVDENDVAYVALTLELGPDLPHPFPRESSGGQRRRAAPLAQAARRAVHG